MANKIDSSIPQNSESPTLGAQRIREFKADFNTLVGPEHDISDGFSVGDNPGFHGEQITGKASGALDTPPPGYGRFLWRVINGITELFHNDDAGSDTQITRGGLINSPPAGSVISYAGVSSPDGWLLAEGTEVSQATYAALYTALGPDAFGVDAGGNFFLPDMRGRIAIGVGIGDASDATSHALADKEGAETHRLLTAEMPSHNHEFTVRDTSGATDTSGGGGGSQGLNPTTNTGSGENHNNLQPSLALNYIIKY